MRDLFKAASLVGVLCLAGSSAATAYDLQADWSNASNPNGSWTYREGSNALPFVASWQSALGGWSSAQSGWAYSENGNNRLPFWFQSNGTETFAHDFLAGDIVVHTTDAANGVGNGLGNVLWTSSTNSLIDISGSVWMGRDIGRANDWKLYVNGTLLRSGSIFSGDVYSRANPFDLSTGAGAGSLTGLLVNADDTVKLEFKETSGSGDFVGVNLRINATPVPEPATMAALALGALALLRRRGRA